MKILIVGCGKVGRALASELSKEKHEIYLLDSDKEVLREVSTLIDCMGVIGQAASLSDLKSANVEECELMLAMTASDETNILSCLFAKKANPKIKTIARVRSTIYSNDLSYIRDELGLTMVVNPEEITAREIARTLRLPAAMKVETFSRSRVLMVSFELPQENVLVNKKVMEVSKISNLPILVIGIERGEEAIIPNGQNVLNAKDKVTIMGRPFEVAEFFEKINMIKRPVKEVFIAGGSRIAYYLAKNLIKTGIKVKIVEVDKDKCIRLAEDLPKAEIICGDATESGLLAEEGINDSDAFVALTGLDEENMLLSLYAKSTSDMKVITKVNHIAYDNVIAGLDLGLLVSPKEILTEQVIRYVRGFNNALTSANITTLYRIMNNKAEVLSFRILKESSITNKPIKEIATKDNLLIGAIIRDNQVIIPQGNDEIKLNDMVLVATSNLGLDDIEGILK